MAETNEEKKERLEMLVAHDRFFNRNQPATRCVMCREIRTEEELKILSHIMGRSVLRDADNVNCFNADTSRQINYTALGYNGYCQNCETRLSSRGEGRLNPDLHLPLVKRFRENVVDGFTVWDSGTQCYFYYVLSLAFRVALSTKVGFENSNNGHILRHWIRAVRPYMLDVAAQPPSLDLFSAFLSVPTLKDKDDWLAMHHNTYLWNAYAFLDLQFRDNAIVFQICHGPFFLTCVANGIAGSPLFPSASATFIPVLIGQPLVIPPDITNGSNRYLLDCFNGIPPDTGIAELLTAKENLSTNRRISEHAEVVQFTGPIFLLRPAMALLLEERLVSFKIHERMFEMTRPGLENSIEKMSILQIPRQSGLPREALWELSHDATHQSKYIIWFEFGVDRKLKLHRGINLTRYSNLARFEDFPFHADIQAWFEIVYAAM